MKLTVEQCFQEAKNFKSRSEFARKSNRAYNYLWRYGLLDDACAHMPISYRYSYVKWNVDSAKNEAKKYTCRSEFKRENSGAYCFLLDNDLLDDACAHMLPKWSKEKVANIALSYKTMAEFRRCEPQAHQFASRHGFLDEVCSHMPKKRKWSKDEVLRVASGFSDLRSFVYAYNGAFKHAWYNGYIDEVKALFDDSKYGFDKEKPAVLYGLKITLNDGSELYKVGITNREARKRISGMGVGLVRSIGIEFEIQYKFGRDARMQEKAIHARFSEFKYRGSPVLLNGNDELFTVNVINLLRGENHV